ncbi:universal stress protein [Aquabacterium sp.]|jgi:nucleotide-binding universal stress UspA family protein|uniref:universal stress protein n=1 Tax=Aquabacterium sp. TaxID=1872578 RepID=UPI003D084E33
MNNVMACVDAQGNPAAVCDGAIWAAKALSASLTFLHVLDRHQEKAPQADLTGQIGLGAQENLLSELAELDARRSTLAQEQGRQILEGARQRATSSGLNDVHIRQRHGELVESVAELEGEHALIVMGKHDHPAWVGRHLDHHVERVIRAVKRPVLVMADGHFETPGSFVLAYDGSDASRKLLDQVGHNNLLKGLMCRLVHVGDVNAAMQEELGRAAEQIRAHGLHVETALIPGDVEHALADYVAEKQSGLLVMGAYGHSRVRRLVVGSTTTTLLRTSKVPVLVLR